MRVVVDKAHRRDRSRFPANRRPPGSTAGPASPALEPLGGGHRAETNRELQVAADSGPRVEAIAQRQAWLDDSPGVRRVDRLREEIHRSRGTPARAAFPPTVQRFPIEATRFGDLETENLGPDEILAMLEQLARIGDSTDQRTREELRRAAQERAFRGGGTVAGFIWSKIILAPANRMTPEIRNVLESMLQLPQANQAAASELDALVRLNYPLSPNVTRLQYNTLMYVMGHRRVYPGAGSLSDLQLDDEGTVSGRPGFPASTLRELRPDPTQARRHINAWHTLRALMNKFIAQVGGVGNAVDILRKLPAKVPPEVTKEIDKLIAKAPARVFGAQPENGKVILKLLFIMNGNPANLWLGSSLINSLLPQIYKSVMAKVDEQASVEGLLTLCRRWLSEEGEGSTTDEARWQAAERVADTWVQKLYPYLRDEVVEPRGQSPDAVLSWLGGHPQVAASVLSALRSAADGALNALEVDLQPGSAQEAENIRGVQRQVMISYGLQLHGALSAEHIDLDLVMALFSQLLSYPE